MRGRAGWLSGGFAAAMMALGCSTSPGPALAPPPPAITEISDHFSGGVAVSHIAALARLGPRPPGSPADRAARLYLKERFEAAGAKVHVLSAGARRHLVADLAGDSDDVLLLVAAYPAVESALELDEWMGDAGAAFLLELARVLALSPRPYTLRFALAQTGPVPAGEDAGAEADPGADLRASDARRRWSEPAEARHQILTAGEGLAEALAGQGDFERLRAVLVFEGLARPALRVARDLRSHPIYREIFWDSAARLGKDSIFPKDAGWASARSLHLGFKERGMDRVLALVDEALARPELTVTLAASRRSAASLDGVGLVTIDALSRIMHRLSRIDAFSAGGEQPEAPEQASPEIIGTLPSI